MLVLKYYILEECNIGVFLKNRMMLTCFDFKLEVMLIKHLYPIETLGTVVGKVLNIQNVTVSCLICTSKLVMNSTICPSAYTSLKVDKDMLNNTFIKDPIC